MRQSDELNDFKICDPDLRIDRLPLPFAHIQDFFDQLFRNLFQQIHHIQNDRKNKNYDGLLKQLTCSSSYQVQGVSCFSKEASILNTSIFAIGDCYGSISIYDAHQKALITKKEVFPGKRIIHISSFTCKFKDFVIITYSVVARGDPNVQVLRFKKNQTRLYSTASIGISSFKASQTTQVSTFPYQCQLSNYGQFLAVSTYSGKLFLFKLPDLPEAKYQQKNSEIQEVEQEHAEDYDQNQPAQNRQSSNNKIALINLQVPLQEIKQSFASIDTFPLTFPKSFEQTLKALKRSKLNVTSAASQQKKDEAKKKGDKKESKTQVVQPKQQKKLDVYQQIKNQVSAFGVFIVEKGKDLSKEIELPRIRPITKFISQAFLIKDKKMLAKVQKVFITTQLLVSYQGTKEIRIYQLQSSQFKNYPRAVNEQTHPDPPNFKLIKKTNTLFAISCIQISQDSVFVAVGFQEGTIIIYDVYTLTEKSILDRHKSKVSCIRIFESGRLISGDAEGSIHIYQIQKGSLLAQRTNIFKTKIKYHIKDILINNVGIAFALDSLGRIKMYDLWRGQKIAKLSPLANMIEEMAVKTWVCTPKPIWSCTLTDLLVVSIEVSQQVNEESLTPKKIHSFKIFELMINTFQGLYNIYRKNPDKAKLLNCFSHLEWQQLYDKHFEIPNFPAADLKSSVSIKKNLKTQKGVPSLKSFDSFSSKSPQTNKPKLTSTNLHPEQMLFIKKNVDADVVYDQQKQLNKMRKKAMELVLLENQLGKSLAIFRKNLEQSSKQTAERSKKQ